MTTLSVDAIGASISNIPTFIDILLDETGSMSSCSAATVNGFNTFVTEQREVGGSCYLTLSKFDSSSIRTPYENLAIDMVPELSFHPGASTNLYDVVGKRVTELLKQDRQGRSLVVVITDGEENASTTFRTSQSVKTVLAEALEKGVSFLYFGAGHNAKKVALEMGFPEHVITVFDTARMTETMQTVSAQTRAFRVGEAA